MRAEIQEEKTEKIKPVVPETDFEGKFEPRDEIEDLEGKGTAFKMML